MKQVSPPALESYGTLYAARSMDGSAYTIRRDPTQPLIAESGLPFDLLNSTLDFSLASEDYCIGNFMMGFDLYDYYTGRLFPVTAKDCKDYEDGKPVTLQGRLPDLDDCLRMAQFDPDQYADLPAERANTLLYEKLYAAQAAWLKAVSRAPAKEIIDLAGEIYARQTILTVLEDQSLLYDEAVALLNLPSPMSTLCQKYRQADDSLSVAYDVMETCAGELLHHANES